MDPLIFDSFLREVVWGQRRLETALGKTLPGAGPYGEAWELSGHAPHVSRVVEGPLTGQSIAEIWRDHHAALTGQSSGTAHEFPLLLKFLDCEELLSVQVHPTDAIAQELVNEPYGKTEAWVVLGVGPNARIYAGLKPGITQADLERSLAEKTVADCLHTFVPQPGDCLFLRAGTVHAVGGGVLMAEVQQSSDTTFRLYDWDRVGLDGKPRALHIPESIRSIDWKRGPVSPVRPLPFRGLPSHVQGEHLVECEYFTLDRFRVSQAWETPYDMQLSLWMVLAGAAELHTKSGYRRSLQAGETIVIPASGGTATWTPRAGAPLQLLGITIPGT